MNFILMTAIGRVPDDSKTTFRETVTVKTVFLLVHPLWDRLSDKRGVDS
jgi:hypothetical protein